MRNDQKDAAKLEPHLRRIQAAKYITDTYGIPCSPKTLAKYACVGGGPPFRLAVLQSDTLGSGTPRSQKQIQRTEDTESALPLRAARLHRLLRFCRSIACTIATLAYAVAR
jgi:hypothetical protein